MDGIKWLVEIKDKGKQTRQDLEVTKTLLEKDLFSTQLWAKVTKIDHTIKCEKNIKQGVCRLRQGFTRSRSLMNPPNSTLIWTKHLCITPCCSNLPLLNQHGIQKTDEDFMHPHI